MGQWLTHFSIWAAISCGENLAGRQPPLKFWQHSPLVNQQMNRRETDRSRRPPKRSRSPDERERSPREEKRRRSYANDSRRERSISPRPTRSSQQNGREERRDQGRSKERHHRGIQPTSHIFDQDELHRYERERDRRPPPPPKEREPEKRPVDRKPHPTQEVAIQPPSKPKPIIATSLLEEEEPPLLQLMGLSRFSSTKGKKHVDYGGVETHKTTRKYRQYMNRPGGFNRPLDPSVLVP